MNQNDTYPELKSEQVSVIIPVYNRARPVTRAIDSVLKQTRPPLEIIVVDDGSTDETPDVLRQYGSKIKIIRQAHRGVSAARNRGIRSSRGQWIALLDSDDEWMPKKLAMAEEFHHAHPEYLIFQSEEIWIRKGKRVNPKKKHRKYGGWIFKQSLPLCIVSPSAVIFHRSLLEQVGLFDESFPVCEDYDLWLRVTRRFPVGLDRRFGIIKYGGHEDQLSRKYWGMDRFRIQAMEKHLSDPELPDDLRAALLSELIRKTEILIVGGKKRNKHVAHLEEKLKEFRKRFQTLPDAEAGRDI